MEAQAINTAVQAGASFEKLSIIGVLFLIILVLIYLLTNRKKQDDLMNGDREKLNDALERIATASENNNALTREMIQFHKDIIQRDLSEIKGKQDQCLQNCRRAS